MSPKLCRKVIFYKTYFEDFFVEQKQKVKDKIIWTIGLIEEIEKVPEKYLKHITSTGVVYMKLEFSLEVIFLEYFAFLTKAN